MVGKSGSNVLLQQHKNYCSMNNTLQKGGAVNQEESINDGFLLSRTIQQRKRGRAFKSPSVFLISALRLCGVLITELRFRKPQAAEASSIT